MKTPYIFLIIIISISCKKQNIHTDEQSYFTSSDLKDNKTNSMPVAVSQDSTYEETSLGFAFVNDTAGFIKDTKGYTLNNGQIVYNVFGYDTKSDSVLVDYYADKEYTNDVLLKSSLTFISQYPKISQTDINDNSVTLSKDVISITLKSEPFVQSKYKLHYQDNFLYTIDNDSIWGTDGNIPKIQYQSITISFGNKIIEIPAKGLHNLYEPNLDYTSAYYDKKNDILYLQTFNSDAAGAYAVLWVIEKGKYKERVVVYPF